jgi:hypothetical protein
LYCDRSYQYALLETVVIDLPGHRLAAGGVLAQLDAREKAEVAYVDNAGKALERVCPLLPDRLDRCRMLEHALAEIDIQRLAVDVFEDRGVALRPLEPRSISRTISCFVPTCRRRAWYGPSSRR